MKEDIVSKSTVPGFITLHRTGRPLLRFTGKLLGSGTDWQTNATSWINVRIYRTSGGAYVGNVVRITLWENEQGREDGQAVATAVELLEWLQDKEGVLNSAAQEAVEVALELDNNIADAWIKSVA